ncbi:MAG: 50S ribosomal protein L11 methyltransferase [Oscillospiraceae bacterium]|jgi:ribosomal protein L11 methyltransferase|nr:50S ribosomal protein L11 methyltransferase [Oscillospiraceae bacterium]
MSKWNEITLPVTPETLENLTARLVAEGFESFQIVDGKDIEIARPAWELFDAELLHDAGCRIVLYLPAGDRDGLARLRDLCPGMTARERDEEEWADAWKQYYKPMPVGERLLIQPAWLPPDNPGDRAVFLNDPGMSFGTGLHASTRLCLEMLESMRDAGGGVPYKRVLDIGCGSGILSLCALLLGGESAAGVDIDPLAVRTAEKNARLNGVEERFTAFAGNYLSDEALRRAAGGFDLVFSNIVADIVIALVPLLAPFRARCRWVASGIIEERLEDVLSAARAAGLEAREIRVSEGWAAALFFREGP